jgi:hypothetical protein
MNRSHGGVPEPLLRTVPSSCTCYCCGQGRPPQSQQRAETYAAAVQDKHKHTAAAHLDPHVALGLVQACKLLLRLDPRLRVRQASTHITSTSGAKRNAREPSPA